MSHIISIHDVWEEEPHGLRGRWQGLEARLYWQTSALLSLEERRCDDRHPRLRLLTRSKKKSSRRTTSSRSEAVDLLSSTTVILVFIAAKNLYESCTYNQQCSERNEQAFCQELDSRQTQCYCRKGYHAKKAHEIPIRYECVLGTNRIYFPQCLKIWRKVSFHTLDFWAKTLKWATFLVIFKHFYLRPHTHAPNPIMYAPIDLLVIFKHPRLLRPHVPHPNTPCYTPPHFNTLTTHTSLPHTLHISHSNPTTPLIVEKWHFLAIFKHCVTSFLF